MCKASLLYNIGTFSTFHVEKPTVLLSLSNVKDWGKKRQRLQRLQKENKHYGLQSHYSHGVKKKRKGRKYT
jgi:hypothetical protein